MSLSPLVRRHVIIFCLLAYALLWVPFAFVSAAKANGGDPGAWAVILGLMGPYSPMLAALIMRLAISREAFRDAHLGIRRTAWHLWLVALLLPFFWNAVQDALQIALGFSTIDWSQVSRGLYRIPINLFGGFLIFIGEEFGWRSYLLEKLRPLPRSRALLLTGVIWSLWHAPMLLTSGSVYGTQVNLLGAAVTSVVFVLMGFIVGWLYLEAKSVWPCVLLHSYNNLISFKLLREAWSVTNEPSLLQNALMALGPILLVWLVLAWRGAFADRPEPATAAEPSL